MLDAAAVIPLEESEACFRLLAVDDDILENNEVFMIMVAAQNRNDMINTNVLVVISDNDGIK